MSALMTDPRSAITIVAEKGLVIRFWSLTLRNVQQGNQKVNSTYVLDIKIYHATNLFFCFALSTFSHLVKSNIS